MRNLGHGGAGPLLRFPTPLARHVPSTRRMASGRCVAWPVMVSVDGSPVPYPARARVGGVTIASTDAAVRVDVRDAAPLLWFPRSDVDETALDRLPDGSWRSSDDGGHIAFDHEAVDLDLIDTAPGDDERDVTTKRFPTWGDARDLIEVLDVQPADGDAPGDHRFTSPARSDWRRPVVEGSQLLAQSIVAAEPGRFPAAGPCTRRWSSPGPPTPAPPTTSICTRRPAAGRSPRSRPGWCRATGSAARAPCCSTPPRPR